MSDREAILHLIYRYAELIDAGDFGLSADCFPGVLRRAALRRCPARRTSPRCSPRPRQFDDGTPRTRHLVLNPIVEADGDRATARRPSASFRATDRIALQPDRRRPYDDRFARDRMTAGTSRAHRRRRDGRRVSDHLLIRPAAFDR